MNLFPRLGLAALLFLALAAPRSASAQDPTMTPQEAPSVDHHDFNPVVPTEFKGLLIPTAWQAPSAVEGEDPIVLDVYTSGPLESDRQLIVIHEWWGLNAHVMGVADHFAKLGYRVYAVDLYNGKSGGDDPEKARELMTAANANPERLHAMLKMAVEYARRENPKAKIGTIGWCFGGGWSLQTAIRNAEVDACVVYYGQLVTEAEALKTLDAPVLAIIAEKDGWITPAMGEAFSAAMKEAGKDCRVEVYPADHAFANPSSPRFSEAEARDAWAKTLAFFDEHLKAEAAEVAAE